MSQKIITINNNLLSNKEAAIYLGLSADTLDVWRSTKRHLDILPYIKVGRYIKYRQSTLDTFLEKRTVGGENHD